jgi:hypothetical protein
VLRFLLWLATFNASALFNAGATEFFENHIRPLLEERCVECHGASKSKGGLRLDSRQGWQQGGDTGTAIIPGKAAESLLVKAVRYTLPDLHMPPKERLSPAQVALLEQWINEGAVDPRDTPPTSNLNASPVDLDAGRKHWAFQPLLHVLPPAVSPAAAHPVDRFLEKERMRQGIVANPRADRRSLLRRATFDLTGLPPTPEELASFENDSSPDREAFARAVDRLLGTHAYGERWARHWLDVARYADTAGDGSDYPVREAGLYRDWVVRSFERDLPVDEFLRQQIAGDILAREAPETEYADLVTATGFLAIGKRYGYKPSPDFQHLDFADVIDSVGRSLLGLSLGCARCHDHKYEPVTTADYYALYGIFQSTTWAFPGGEEQKRPSQFPSLLPPAQTREREEARARETAAIEGRIAPLQEEKNRLSSHFFGGWADLGFEEQSAGKAPSKPWLSQGSNTVLAESQSPYVHIHPKGNVGVRVGGGKSGDGIRYVLASPLKLEKPGALHFSLDFRVPETTPTGQGAHRLYLGRGVILSTAADFSLSTDAFAMRREGGWEVIRSLAPGQWYTLQVRFDGADNSIRGFVGKPGDMTPLPVTPIPPSWDRTLDTFICDGNGHTPGVPAPHDLDNIGIRRDAFPAPGEVIVEDRKPSEQTVARIKELEKIIAELAQKRDALKAEPAYPVAYAVAEGKPSDARIQKRGEPEKLGDAVPRRFLSVLGGKAVENSEGASGRRDLANWITRDHAALTARVFVNRVWQWHFGVGLVGTPSDFGTRGEKPSHPELLDWLAGEFIQSGWSLKFLHKLLLSSDAYAMSSAVEPAHQKTDAANRWLGRYGRFALDAESLRDAMLEVSGELDHTPPAPHPFPEVGTWKYTIHNPFHAVYQSHRRSLYLMIQRNRRHPFLALFDSADPNLSVASRFPTITPKQTLFLMNSPFVAERASGLAKRLLSHPGSEAERIRFALELTHAVKADAEEIHAVEGFLEKHRQQDTAGRAAEIEAVEQRAWTALSRILLTSNAFLYVD